MNKNVFEINNEALKKIVTLTTFIAGVILIVVMLNFDNKNKFRERVIERIKNEHYHGIVVNRYYDKNNHNTPMIVFSDKSEASIYGHFYNQVKLGDSLLKKKGSTKIIIYRPGKKIELENLSIIK